MPAPVAASRSWKAERKGTPRTTGGGFARAAAATQVAVCVAVTPSALRPPFYVEHRSAAAAMGAYPRGAHPRGVPAATDGKLCDWSVTVLCEPLPATAALLAAAEISTRCRLPLARVALTVGRHRDAPRRQHVLLLDGPRPRL